MTLDHRTLMVDVMPGLLVVGRLRPREPGWSRPWSRFGCFVTTLGTAALHGPHEAATAYACALAEHVAREGSN